MSFLPSGLPVRFYHQDEVKWIYGKIAGYSIHTSSIAGRGHRQQLTYEVDCSRTGQRYHGVWKTQLEYQNQSGGWVHA